MPQNLYVHFSWYGPINSQNQYAALEGPFRFANTFPEQHFIYWCEESQIKQAESKFSGLHNIEIKSIESLLVEYGADQEQKTNVQDMKEILAEVTRSKTFYNIGKEFSQLIVMTLYGGYHLDTTIYPSKIGSNDSFKLQSTPLFFGGVERDSTDIWAMYKPPQGSEYSKHYQKGINLLIDQIKTMRSDYEFFFGEGSSTFDQMKKISPIVAKYPYIMAKSFEKLGRKRQLLTNTIPFALGSISSISADINLSGEFTDDYKAKLIRSDYYSGLRSGLPEEGKLLQANAFPGVKVYGYTGWARVNESQPASSLMKYDACSLVRLCELISKNQRDEAVKTTWLELSKKLSEDLLVGDGTFPIEIGNGLADQFRYIGDNFFRVAIDEDKVEISVNTDPQNPETWKDKTKLIIGSLDLKSLVDDLRLERERFEAIERPTQPWQSGPPSYVPSDYEPSEVDVSDIQMEHFEKNPEESALQSIKRPVLTSSKDEHTSVEDKLDSEITDDVEMTPKPGLQ